MNRNEVNESDNEEPYAYSSESTHYSDATESDTELEYVQSKSKKKSKKVKKLVKTKLQTSIKTGNHQDSKFKKWKNKTHSINIHELPDYERIVKILNTQENIHAKRKKQSHIRITNPAFNSFWNSSSYITNQIEKCVLHHDWNSLTKLLLNFTDTTPKYRTYAFRVTLLNFISNPASQRHDLLNRYLRECFSCQTDEDINDLLTSYFHLDEKIKEEDGISE